MTQAESLESTLLCRAGFRHAFFTRHGGVSPEPFASLNFSVSVGDDPAHVAENIERAARRLGVSSAALSFLSQVHGAEVKVAHRATALALRQECGDAVISGELGVAVGVRVADCVPILIADPEGRKVGAIHAGWKGLVAGVVGAAVARLRAELPSEGRILAAIGPHISLSAFEVSEEVAQELSRASSDPGVVDWRAGARPHVDLRRLARAQLGGAGLADADIDDVAGCTVGDPSRFFSYRRDGAVGGRHLAAIVAE